MRALYRSNEGVNEDREMLRQGDHPQPTLNKTPNGKPLSYQNTQTLPNQPLETDNFTNSPFKPG
jgi:hypothetical protein